MHRRFCLAALGASGFFSLQSSGASPSAAPEEDVRPDQVRPRPTPAAPESPPEPAPVAPAPDTLGGHVALGANVGWSAPFAKLGSGLTQGDVMSSGPGVSLDLGYGVSRTMLIGVWGQALWLASSTRCTDCRTTSWAVGPWVRYHLAQGVRFDPWIAGGLGWRATTVKRDEAKATYSGPEWIRVAVGGDWYPIKNLAFGPVLELEAGTYTNRPTVLPVPRRSGAPTDEGTTWHWLFVGGLRVVFDTPGK